jgi:hypothetical protein
MEQKTPILNPHLILTSVLILICRQDKRDSERLSTLCKVTQPISSRVRASPRPLPPIPGDQ